MAISAPAMAAVAGVQVGMQYLQSRKEAEAAEAYRKQQNKQALASMQDQYGQMSAAESDSIRQSLEDSVDAQSEAVRARGKVNLMAAASGTGGLSVTNLLQDIDQQEGQNLSQISRNRSIEAYNLRQQANAVRYGAASQIDNRRIRKPSAITAAINGVSSSASAYQSGKATSSLYSQASQSRSGGGLYSNIQGGT